MALDPIQQANAKITAQAYVIKALINAVHQLAPQAGLGNALQQMINNSVPHMNVVGSAAPEEVAEMRSAVLAEALAIVHEGTGA